MSKSPDPPPRAGEGVDATAASSPPSSREKIDSLFDMLRLPPELAALVSSDERLPKRVGRYKIVKLLGQGGFGSVYLGYDDRLERPVAIKVPASHRANLLADARKAASLQHDGIVTVHAVEEEPDGSFFVVMAYLEGGSLADRIEAGARLSADQAARLVADVADAVHHAHEQGIVHRDLKPENILLDCQDRPHVADFGLAVYESQRSDRDGEICGTTRYMAPEQVLGQMDRLDARTDVWGLGVVLFELLTSKPPFSGESREQLFARILHGDPTPPTEINSEIPDNLEAVALRCLAKEPADRYGSAAEVADMLRRCLAEPPEQARPADSTKPDRRLARSRLVGMAIAASLVLAAVLVGVGRLDRQADPTGTEVQQEAARFEQQAKKFDYARTIQSAYRAWQNADVKSALELLNQSAPRPGEDDIRGFEWYYLRRLCEGGERTLRGHQGRVYGASFSPDGKRLASCGEDGTIRIWESDTGRLAATLEANAGPVYAVAFSPDGQLLATGGEDANVRLWDARTYQLQAALKGHTDGVACLAFSPDGKTIASGSEDTTVRTWDVTTGRARSCLRGHSDIVHCIAFSPDGKKLFSASEDRSIKAWDPDASREPQTLSGDWGRCFSLAPSPNGRVLAVASEMVIHFLDLLENTQVQLPLDHRNPVRSMAFSPDGQSFASTGDDQVVRIWDVNSLTTRHVYRAHTDRVYHLAFSPRDGLLASVSRDGSVRIWDTARPQDRQPLLEEAGLTIYDVGFSPDGSSVAVLMHAQGGSRVTMWNVASAQEVATLRLPAESRFIRLAFLPGGTDLALCDHRGPIVIWSGDRLSDLRTLTDVTARYQDIAVAPDGELLAVASSENDSTKLLHVETGEILAELPGQRCVAFSPDSRLVAFESANSQYAVELWDVEARRSAATLPGHTSEVYRVAFSKNGRYLATASEDCTTRLWDVKAGREHRTLRAHSQAVHDIAFHPNGKRIATAGYDGIVVLWDVDTGAALLSLPVNPGQRVEAVAFSPDGTTLATGSRNGVVGHVDLWHAPGMARRE